MKENNLYEIEIGYYCKNWKNGEITKYRKYVNKHTIETYFTKLKIIDGEIVFDIYVNALKDIKPLEYYNVENTLKRELEKLWT